MHKTYSMVIKLCQWGWRREDPKYLKTAKLNQLCEWRWMFSNLKEIGNAKSFSLEQGIINFQNLLQSSYKL